MNKALHEGERWGVPRALAIGKTRLTGGCAPFIREVVEAAVPRPCSVLEGLLERLALQNTTRCTVCGRGRGAAAQFGGYGLRRGMLSSTVSIAPVDWGAGREDMTGGAGGWAVAHLAGKKAAGVRWHGHDLVGLQ